MKQRGRGTMRGGKGIAISGSNVSMLANGVNGLSKVSFSGRNVIGLGGRDKSGVSLFDRDWVLHGGEGQGNVSFGGRGIIDVGPCLIRDRHHAVA